MTASRDKVEAQRLRRIAERRARFSVVPSATVGPSTFETASPSLPAHEARPQNTREAQLQPLRRPVERRAAVGPIIPTPAAPPKTPTPKPARTQQGDPLLRAAEA